MGGRAYLGELPFGLRFYSRAMLIAWTTIVGASLGWNWYRMNQDLEQRARMEARGSSDKDLLLQRWIAKQGGIYVAVSEDIQPNPDLAHISERDVETPSGRQLTLMNAAFVMRRLYSSSDRKGQIQGHFTSLKPIRGGNSPDPWEKHALELFESGVSEVSSVEILHDEPYMRFMRPMMTTISCVKCHGDQGHEPGDVRGGFSVSIPMAPYLKEASSLTFPLFASHGVIWAFGFIGIAFATRKIRGGINEVGKEVAERERAEEEMRGLRCYLENIVNSMPSVLVGTDANGRVTHWNVEAEKTTGVIAEKAHGRSLVEVFPQLSAEAERIKYAIERRHVQKDTKVRQELNDEIRFWDITVFPLVSNGVEGAVVRVDDVTELVRIEEMMIQSEKMLSVGGLAAGMAHEINNPLAGIMQNAQLLQNRISPGLAKNREAARECGVRMEMLTSYMEKRGVFKCIDGITESGKRAAEIVNNMLSFSRRSEGIADLHDVAVLLDKTVELASNDYDLKKRYDFRKIHIVREYDSGIPEVWCEASKIQQVFLNILKNGAEAISARPDQSVAGKFILRILDEDGAVRIEIEDNGVGMNEDTRKRVFEPFFTTKGVGIGTGLGLSVSYFIVTENHRGTMTVESTEGKGTRFIIRLPCERRRK